MTFTKLIGMEDELHFFENKLLHYVDNSTDNKKFKEIMKYSLFSGGKRLRPILTIASYQLFSKDFENVIPFACAIELIHTYSLIHDDLPAMDDDDLRRGKPTSHIKYGEDLAILAGDALMNLAYETLFQALLSQTRIGYRLASMEIAKAAGVNGMIAGQVLDIKPENKSKEAILSMYSKKTGALLKASVLAGAYAADANETEIRLLDCFSYNLGLAFQLQDDLLDYERDMNAKKLTLGIHYSKDELAKEAKRYSLEALNYLEMLRSYDISKLKRITELLLDRRV